MKRNLLVIVLSLSTAIWSIGQEAPEWAGVKDTGKATKAMDLSDFKSKQFIKGSSLEEGDFFEGFEGSVFPPAGWQVISGGSTDRTWKRDTDYIISGNASVSISYHSSEAHDDWLITPALVPTAGCHIISFKARQANFGNPYRVDKFNIKLSTTGNNKEDFTITLAENVGPVSTVSETFTYDLSAFNGQTVYFAVQAISKNQLRLIVDDFRMSAPVVTTKLQESFEGELFPPAGWKVIDDGSSGRAWERYTESPISGNASAAIFYSASSHDDWLITPPLTLIKPVAGRNIISFKAKQGNEHFNGEKFNVMLSTKGNNKEDFTITIASNIRPSGTTPETFMYDLSEYDGQVVYIAIQATSKDQYRLIVDDFLLRTIISDTPYKESFEDYLFPPAGWRVIDAGSPGWTWRRYADSPISGKASARIESAYDTHDDWLISPPIMPVAGCNSISFLARQGNLPVEKFNVMLSTTGNNKEDFTVTLASDVGPATTRVETFMYDLSAYNDQVVYVAIQAISYNKHSLLVDDFALNPIDLVVTGGNKGYSQIPLCQLDDALTLKTNIENRGSAFTDDFDVIQTVRDASYTTLFSSTDVLSGGLDMGEKQTVSAGTCFDATTLTPGSYTYTHLANYAADPIQINNMNVFDFTVTDYIYARDDGEFAEYGVGYNKAFGNLFNIVNEATITGVQLVWPDEFYGSEDVSSYRLVLYKVREDMSIESTIFTTKTYECTQSLAGQTVNIAVCPVVIQPGAYILAIKQTSEVDIQIAYDMADHGFYFVADDADNPTEFTKIDYLGYLGLRMDFTPRNTVTFAVTDGTNPIEGATVTARQGETVIETVITNSSGEAEIYVVDGDYTYSVNALGYFPKNDVSLTVNENMTVNVKMDEAPPTLMITPAAFTFAETHVALSSAPQSFTMQNIGTGTITIEPSDITITGADAGQFTLTTIGSTANLSAEVTVSFTVAFTPSTVGEKTATIELKDNLEKTYSININGNAVDYTISEFPYKESFDEEEFPPMGWSNLGVTSWERSTESGFPACRPFGAGMLIFSGYVFWGDTQGTLISRRLDMGSGDYSVGFKMFRDNSGYDSDKYEKVEVYVNTQPGTAGATKLGIVHRYTGYEPIVSAEGWYDYSFKIPDEFVQSPSYIMLVATRDLGSNIYVDEFVVGRVRTVTLAADPGASGIVAGGGNYVEGAIAVLTATPQAGYVLTSWTNSVSEIVSKEETFNYVVGDSDVSFTANFATSRTVTFTVVDVLDNPVKGVSIVIKEDTLTTNASGVATIELADGNYSYTISKFDFVDATGTAEVDGAALPINITLQAQTYAPFGVTARVVNENQIKVIWNPNFADDMESYENFIIEDIGNYTLVDMDSTMTDKSNEFGFPNENYTGSYIVFNPSATTPPLSSSRWNPHSGNKYLACFGTQYSKGSETNDDWLITPRVKVGPGMRFSFWSTSTGNFVKERFKIGISTTNTDLSSFTFITESDYVEVPGTWKQYVYDLNAYVGQYVYLAINCVSSYGVAFLVDDIYIGAPKAGESETLTGFNIYLDDVEVASGITTTEYTLPNTLTIGNTYTVGVQSVYGSEVSEIATTSITISKPYMVVFTVLDAANNPVQDATIEIYGVTLTTDASGQAVIELTNGNYDYTVSKSGYADFVGSLVVNNAIQFVGVNMTTGIDELAASFVRLYPNPVESQLVIERDNSDEVIIELYNLSGTLIGTTKTGNMATTINVGALGSGSYFVRIIGNNSTPTVLRFIKK